MTWAQTKLIDFNLDPIQAPKSGWVEKLVGSRPIFIIIMSAKDMLEGLDKLG